MVSLDWQQDMASVLDESERLSRRIERQTSIIRLLVMLLKLSGFRLSLCRIDAARESMEIGLDDVNRPGFAGGSISLRGWSHGKAKQVLAGGPGAGGAAGESRASGEHGSQWAAIRSIAEKIGCTAETLRKWVRQAERDSGKRAGLTTAERERLKELERENRELRRANEILRKASAYFAQAELDRRPK